MGRAALATTDKWPETQPSHGVLEDLGGDYGVPLIFTVFMYSVGGTPIETKVRFAKPTRL